MSHVDAASEISAAAAAVDGVAGVLSLHIGDEAGVPLIGIRIAVPPAFSTRRIVQTLGRVRSAVGRLAPTAVVFVEPDIAASEATPTEAIFIRALD
jgi:hypothetical protein